MRYDYIIVGSGLFGSIFAREATDSGKRCLVLEKRNHIAGNCYSEEIEGIQVSKYGGHIFHTNNKKIWDYVNKFTEFRQYHHFVRVNYDDTIYSFPINMMTLNQLWGIKTPNQAKEKLNSVKIKKQKIDNLEDWILSEVGEEIYKIFIKGYNKKQWDKDPKDLPSSIIKRLPIRLTYHNGYFNDKYQGWPEKGYTDLFENLLKGIDVEMGVDYLLKRDYYNSICDKVIYTGKIDEYYDYRFGDLEYRTLVHENEILDGDFQGCATVNYTNEEVPYTRIIEHKHFQPHKNNNKTVITTEYSRKYKRGDVPFYPINDENNNKKYKQYKQLADSESKVIFGGRLAEYKYYDMHQVVGSALRKVDRWLN